MWVNKSAQQPAFTHRRETESRPPRPYSYFRPGNLDVEKASNNICRYGYQRRDEQERDRRRAHGSEGEDAVLAERDLRRGPDSATRSHNEPLALGLRTHRQLRGAVAPAKSPRQDALKARALRYVRRLAAPPRGATVAAPARP